MMIMTMIATERPAPRNRSWLTDGAVVVAEVAEDEMVTRTVDEEDVLLDTVVVNELTEVVGVVVPCCVDFVMVVFPPGETVYEGETDDVEKMEDVVVVETTAVGVLDLTMVA